MSSATPLADRAELDALFVELGLELEQRRTTAEIVMVGGSWLLWHAQRNATRDVDSARRLDHAVVEAVRRVASRHDLADDWLNDRASMFWPAGRGFDDCTVVRATGGLVIRAAPADVVFVMKLYRALPQDHEDMVLLWPRCGFADPAAAARAFRLAYPHAPDDEFLMDYVAMISAEAGQRPQG